MIMLVIGLVVAALGIFSAFSNIEILGYIIVIITLAWLALKGILIMASDGIFGLFAILIVLAISYGLGLGLGIFLIELPFLNSIFLSAGISGLIIAFLAMHDN